jgi:DNA-binding PadR family transcriptional regulator
MHGYQLRKRLSTTLGPFWAVSFGSLYPCLRRLREAGFVRETSPESGARSRRKCTYEITPAGEECFFSQLESGAVYDAERFRLRFAFFRYLPKESRIGLLERRKVYLQEKLIEFKESLQATKERIDSYTLSLIKHGMESTEQDIRWLEEVIDQERRVRVTRRKKGRTLNV